MGESEKKQGIDKKTWSKRVERKLVMLWATYKNRRIKKWLWGEKKLILKKQDKGWTALVSKQQLKLQLEMLQMVQQQYKDQKRQQ